MNKIFIILIILFLGTSCKQASRVVEASISSILREVAIDIVPGNDLGEIALGSPDTQITVKITNYSSDKIKNLSLAIDATQSSLKFMPNDDDLTISPGGGGTCGTELSSGGSCTYVLNFVVKKAASFNIPVTFEYDNLVQHQQNIFYIKALTGEVANIALVSAAKNKFDFGVLEQTDSSDRMITLEYQNLGGLSARNIDFTLSNDTQSSAYSYSSNCPISLLALQKCIVTLTYHPPSGIDDTAAEKDYTASLVTKFKKNIGGDDGSYSTYFTFKASTIEAKLDTTFGSIYFDNLIAGNTQTNIFRIINKGYKDGFIKKLYLRKKGTDLPFTYCDKGSDSFLNCHKSIEEFPFSIEDTSNCFTNKIDGISFNSDGGVCVFNIIYKPSRNYTTHNSSNDFDGSTLSVEYDSRWKDQEKIRTTKTDLFTINAKFNTKANLVIDSIQFGLNSYIPTISGVDQYLIDLGKIATIKDAVLGKSHIKIKLINTGEEQIHLHQITDNSSTPYTLKKSSVAAVTDQINPYYQSIKYDDTCDGLTVGSCNITFDLIPTEQFPASLQDQYMYDFVMPYKYKTFKVYYSDGSSSDSASERILNLNLKSLQISKGVLVFAETSPYDLGDVVAGNTETVSLTLRNIGAGEVKAIAKMTNGQSFVQRTNLNNWPFAQSSNSTAPDKNCYDIFYNSMPSTTPPNLPDPAKALASGDSCKITIDARDADSYRLVASDFKPVINATIDNYKRAFNNSINNSSEIWERQGYAFDTSTIGTGCPTLASCVIYGLNFQYYDGDASTGSDFGTLQNIYPVNPSTSFDKTKFMNLKVNFKKPPYLILKNPRPLVSSVLIRPTMSFPSFSTSLNYIKNYLSEIVTPVKFSYGEFNTKVVTDDTYGPLYKFAELSKTFSNSLSITDNDLAYYFGTIEVTNPTSDYLAYVDIYNNGGVDASSLTIKALLGGDSAINAIINGNNVTSATTALAAIPAANLRTLNFKITPTATGLISRCFQLSYDNKAQGTWNQNICIYANVITDAPKLSVKVSDVDLSTGVDGLQTTLSAPSFYPNNGLALPDTSDSLSLIFNPIYDSSSYSYKKITLQNLSATNSLKNLNYYFLNTSFEYTSLPLKINELTKFKSIVKVGANDCGYGNNSSAVISLSAGSTCQFIIRYKPTSTGPNDTTVESTNGYLAFSYDAVTNQKMSQFVSIKFRPKRIKKLQIATVNGSTVTASNIISWTGNVPVPPVTSYGISLGNYDKKTTNGFILNSATTSKLINNIIVSNQSSTDAITLLPSGCSAANYLTIPRPAKCSPTFSSGFAIIKLDSNIQIEANTKCFSSVGNNGFFNPSIDSDKCKLKVTFSGSKTYPICSKYDAAIKTHSEIIGGRLLDACNPYVYSIPYVVNGSVSDSIYIHVSGFIEPNRSLSSVFQKIFFNVESVNNSSTTGTVKLTWPALVPNNADLGDVSNYRIYYSANFADINKDNIFYDYDGKKYNSTTKSGYFVTSDFSSSTTSATITGLTAGTEYFFRLAAIRSISPSISYITSGTSTTTNLSNYVSGSDIKILSIPIPKNTEIYSHSLFKLIDLSDLNDGSNLIKSDQPGSIAACKNTQIKYSLKHPAGTAGTLLITKSLIGSNEWGALVNNTTDSTLASTAHWLSDAKIDIFGSHVTDYSNVDKGNVFADASLFFANNGDMKIKYSLDQSIDPNNMVFKAVGGNAAGGYNSGAYYSNNNVSKSFAIRCYTNNPCPTNTAIAFTENTTLCAEP
jgi:hypothetical protein